MIFENYQTTEENFTPKNYEEVKNDEHYHHSLKGCNCEIKIGKSKDIQSVIYYYKVCHTHNVECSKTGWELGWYQGKKSQTSVKFEYNGLCKCGRHFINNTPLKLGLCPYCFKEESTQEQWMELQAFKNRNSVKQNRDKYRKRHNIPLDQEIVIRRLKNLL
ncbi:MAG: hypothetical protein WCN88_04715 [Candidatus Falkowbacteria bacterium]